MTFKYLPGFTRVQLILTKQGREKTNENQKRDFFPTFFVLVLALSLSRFVYGHGEGQLYGGEDEKRAISSGNSVEISEVSQKSIGLKVVEAERRQIEDVLTASGMVKPEPNRV